MYAAMPSQLGCNSLTNFQLPLTPAFAAIHRYIATIVRAYRRCVRVVVSGLLAGLILSVSARADEAPSPERLALAHGRAVLRWNLLFGNMPDQIDPTTWQPLSLHDYDNPRSLIDLLTDELLFNNTDSKAVFRYVNATLIPFVQSHRREYLCHLTEMYAASAIPTSELGRLDDHGMLILLEYGYLFGNTAASLDAAGLKVAADHQQYATRAAADSLRTLGWNSLKPRQSRLHCETL